MQKHNFLKYWVPVLFYAALIFVSSSISIRIEVEITFFDKVLHLIGYSVLGFLLLRALFKYKYNLSKGTLLFLAILLGSLYGISDEFHQSFVDGRIACVSDAVFDSLGTIIGAFIYGRNKTV